jgi:hypothetical protein
MLTNSLHSSWRHVMALSRVADGEKVIVLGAQSGRNQHKPVAPQGARDGRCGAYVEVENPQQAAGGRGRQT